MKTRLFILLLMIGYTSYSQYNIATENGNTINTCTGVFVDSGGTAGNYSNNENYTVTFCSPIPGQTIQLDFTSFDTESIDDFRVYDGNSTAASLLAEYNGTTLPAAVAGTTANATGCITIEFVSDSSVIGTGWEANISCVTPVTAPILMTNGSSSVCSGTFLDSGGVAGNYSSNENLVYTLCPSSAGQAIELDFSDISIDSTDTMTIYDGNSTGASVLATFSGSFLTNVIITGTTANATGCLTIQIVSDATWESSGWEASINCAAPVAPPYLMQDGTINTCSGQFTDSGYFGNYSDNESYTMTICPDTAGQAIQLDFTSFATDQEDYMVIYDGNVVDYNTVLGTYNGNSVTTPFTVAGTIANSSGCLTITFNSNSAFTQAGWSADISCVTPVNPPACQGPGNGVSSAGCAAVVSGGLGLGNVDVTPISCTSGSTCTDIEATYLDIGDTSSYRVESIPYIPPYQFDCLKVPVSANTDDVWSPPVNLPFDFCFYGNTYSQCLIGSNGVITFDTTTNSPGGGSGYSFSDDLPSTNNSLVANAIFGAYHDIDPGVSGEVGYELITLNTGCRALVVAWHDVAMFSSSCNSQLYTGMIVLYENTNIIEVYLEEKNVCSTWNDGNAIVGVQNIGATQAVVAPGRNGLDADWTVTNEAWRFVPDGASITSLSWYEGPTATGPVIGTTPVLNVCPTTSTIYTAEVTYTLCDGSVITDTESTTVAIESCATDIDFDGNNDFIDASSFMGGYGAATQMSWVHLDVNFGVPVAVNGNANAAVGGLNGTNATGAINAAGTDASLGGVSARLNSANTTMNLTLDHTVPIGTSITVSLARDDASSNINISDGASIIGSNNTGTQDQLKHITIVTTQATNTLTFTRVGGSTWIDGVSYSYMSGGDGMVMGQPNNKLWVDAAGTLSGSVVTDTGSFAVTTTTTIPKEIWTHVSSIYDGTNLKLYINGVEEASVVTGGTNLDVDTYRYAIGRDAENDNKFFNGFIQESRVYNVALTEPQLREQIYQPIQNNAGNVSGVIIPKDIDGGSLAWNNLVLYLEMNTVTAGVTADSSGSGVLATVYNVATVQNRTAPLPYVANASGDWSTVGTWQNGSVWDITSLPNKDWAIVQITNNSKVTTTASHTHLGLLVDLGSELEIQNDQLLQNTSYLELDGEIDLVGESQLIQTSNSDLAISSSGYIERDQDGKSNLYHYNYWSSPVNPINTTANNTSYTVSDVLRDGTTPSSPQAINWIAGYDGATGNPISLAEFWIFKFENSPDAYANWTHPQSTGIFSVGQGFTLKGSGAATATQNYTFVGKPNNGVIQHSIGGNNMSLLGNPYASALDAHAFINDNIGGNPSTTGALYFWEHWGGNSHNLDAYEGGYSSLNLTGHVMAVSDPMVSSNGSGTVVPKRYIPVGQGFMVYGDSDGGTVEFNNGQRAFEKESGGNSTFVRASEEVSTSEESIDRVYFHFTTPEGTVRQLLLGVKEGLTQEVDYGYDAKRFNEQHTDCGWKITEESYVIQGIGLIHEGLELPLSINVGTSGLCKFNVSSLADLDENIDVYFKDSELQTETRLEQNIAAEFTLDTGVYTNRFSVVFRTSEILNIDDEEFTPEDMVVYYNAQLGAISINNSKPFNASNIKVYNILGQEVLKSNKQYQGVTDLLLPTQVSSGSYLVQFSYNDKVAVTKKIIIK
ncbi:CUB domain-containing protein [Pseudofulvibacter geojedonensis]|uniref:CUB domain-containing protein n=1 Tax=Pseudofulvibacter geojedonensis TaxID=1123758 RepID=A0ABW3HZ69_9FLAO